MLKNLLEQRKCFKLICGAANKDVGEIERLVALYYEAGCRFFDLSANVGVLSAARRAAPRGLFCISVAAAGDPHCKVQDLGEVLPPLIDAGVDCIELHASGREDIAAQWQWLNENFDGFLSLCVGRGKLSDGEFLARVRGSAAAREPYSTIIQADGLPMSGGRGVNVSGCQPELDRESRRDYAATLQAVAAAQMVQKLDLPIYLMLSGGTNSKTGELARMCGVDYHGIAVGSFARQIKTLKAAQELVQAASTPPS